MRELVIDGSLRDLSGFVQFMENVEYMRMGALLSRMFCTVQSLTIKVPFSESYAQVFLVVVHRLFFECRYFVLRCFTAPELWILSVQELWILCVYRFVCEI